MHERQLLEAALLVLSQGKESSAHTSVVSWAGHFLSGWETSLACNSVCAALVAVNSVGETRPPTLVFGPEPLCSLLPCPRAFSTSNHQWETREPASGDAGKFQDRLPSVCCSRSAGDVGGVVELSLRVLPRTLENASNPREITRVTCFIYSAPWSVGSLVLP